MVHYFLYVESLESLQPGSKIFKVAIGENQRDQIKRSLLDNYAADIDAVFRPWDEDSMFLVEQTISRFNQGSDRVRLPLQIIHVSIRDLYQAIIDGSVDNLDNPPRYYRNMFRAMSILSPIFYFSTSQKSISQLAPTRKTYNLSHRRESEVSNVAISFCLILALFLLVGYLEHVERMM